MIEFEKQAGEPNLNNNYYTNLLIAYIRGYSLKNGVPEIPAELLPRRS